MPLYVRLAKHVGNGGEKHNLSRNYAKYHYKNSKGTRFIALDKGSPHCRGTNMVRSISRLETRWIFDMKSYVPFGLNVDWDINCFINNA